MPSCATGIGRSRACGFTVRRAELDRRADRLFARRLKQAGITTEKTLADFDWTFNPKIPKAKIAELVTARFVETHANLLLIGPPDVGKSHVAAAIAVGAIRAGRRALLRSTFDLAVPEILITSSSLARQADGVAS